MGSHDDAAYPAKPEATWAGTWQAARITTPGRATHKTSPPHLRAKSWSG